ncbi:arylsulfatase [Muricauda sp. 2012CJ35-5]|uniref:Arylsulfatase n=1 Tax=Flagellimonas spongiicola TaxID=2942208 RepID=A0ABT0PXQ4_9FLAO|nr:arylsulfatase [Allomuricauda spongiicola]MCL6275497.1 arylsulfatase [Allomuricauda spongiicola]
MFSITLRCCIKLLFASTIVLVGCKEPNSTSDKTDLNKPNIVIIYLDDLGYGDVGFNGATELQTPNMDKFAENGLVFTDGYASSATCTPSRYALLTGTYPWRKKDVRILPGTAPLIIDTMQMTLPKLLKGEGYNTGIVGKWHLGLGNGNVDWNQKVGPGPNEVGFDFSYIMAATQDRVPTVYIENGYVEGLEVDDPIAIDYQENFEGEPTGLENPELLKMKWHHGHNNSIVNGIPRIGFMKGGKNAQWRDEDMADVFLQQAQAYIKSKKDAPFFLYYALQQPHVPRTPHERFVGKTGLGPRGDVIYEADWCIGELMKTLAQENILENTLVILTSDNGPVVNDGYYDDAVEKLGDHNPAGPLRGGKYSLFQAGTRVPFVTFWKDKIQPGRSSTLVSQLDLFSSLAQLAGSKERTADSEALLKVFLGESDEGREALIIEASTRTALRKGNWVFIPPYEGPAVHQPVNIELGNHDTHQLFNLKTDLGETTDLSEVNPEKLQEMIKTYEAIRAENLN